MPALWKYHEYRNEWGAQALALAIHISDMPTSGDVFPTGFLAQAHRYSEQMADALHDLGYSAGWASEQVSGSRLDSRKRHAMGVALRKGEVDVNELRPYQRRQDQPTLPRIAILASAGNFELHMNPDYVHQVTQTVIAISHACEQVGIEVTACLTGGHSQLSNQQRYQEAQIVYWLTQPDRYTPLQHYATTMGRSRFLWEGFPNVWKQDEQARRRFAALQCKQQVRWQKAYYSINGGNGVWWARQTLQPDITIAIGNLTDTRHANIVLKRDFTVTAAIEATLRQARALLAG